MPHIHEQYDFTTSAFIMHPSEPKILLLKHKKIGKWLQPGGHIELDENPIQALHREIEEETGLNPKQYEFIETANGPKPKGISSTFLPIPFYINEHFWDGKGPHKHIDLCYLIKSRTDILTDSPDGASAVDWFALKEMVKLKNSNELYDDTLQVASWIFNNKF